MRQVLEPCPGPVTVTSEGASKPLVKHLVDSEVLSDAPVHHHHGVPGVLGRVHDDGEIQIVNVRYGIIFDAGSSGTRIHTYSWKEGGYGPRSHFDLIEDDLLKIKPGLSAYKDKTSEAGASLAPLIAHAKKKIPAELVPTTPVFLMATAGLRMVGETAKDAVSVAGI